ncbi:MAG: metallophosphoesterase, partial [Burkholderiaceae bacterium]
ELARGSAVSVLECNSQVIDGVRFLGCTLWSDHRLYASDEERDTSMALAVRVLYDFTRIHCEPQTGLKSDVAAAVKPGVKLSPAKAQQICDQSVAWLDDQFSLPFDGPTVVVTHFAPSRKSIHPQFADSPLNACFVSDLEAHILRWQPDLWVHGHTHNSFDYSVGQTRVVCNPRGYAPGGDLENPLFDPTLTLQV